MTTSVSACVSEFENTFRSIYENMSEFIFENVFVIYEYLIFCLGCVTY